ncbi:SPOSA6832_01640, partial [Sporobolomyces salmonicolor]
MQRDLLRSRLSRLPNLPPIDAPGAGEELDADEEDEALDSFPTDPSSSSSTISRPLRKRLTRQDYSPLSAQGYFAQALEVEVPISSAYVSSDPSSSSPAHFRVYYTPPAPTAPSTRTAPTGLLDPDNGDDDERTGRNGVVFVCVHGAGYSGLSFACVAQSLVEKGDGKVGVLAYDARGHEEGDEGKTRMPPAPALAAVNETEQPKMALENLADDLVRLLKVVWPDRAEAPSVILVGHSMGGAVVADACNRIQESVTEVIGVAVVDVVEGTAIDALPSMSALVATHPTSFDSQEAAIGTFSLPFDLLFTLERSLSSPRPARLAGSLDSRTLNNPLSARISVPPLLKPGPVSPSTGETSYTWRVDLQQTEPYWRGWFTGLSAKFLGCRTAKLLLLAGTDRLDKELLIGQMQGKYQLEVYPDTGHCVHEDAPTRTAETLLSFWERNDRTDVLKGVKKLGGPAP